MKLKIINYINYINYYMKSYSKKKSNKEDWTVYYLLGIIICSFIIVAVLI